MKVWSRDPNLMFIKSKQGYLFACAIILLVVLCVPYTTILLLGPQVRGYISNYCCSRWWIKLKPFFDAYNSPYGDRYRFWTGLLLLVRVFIIIMTLVAQPYVLPILTSVIATLLALSTCFRGVYKKGYLNLLESWFLLNIIFIAASAENHEKKTQNIAIVSLSLAFVVFIAIMLFHIYLKVNKTTTYMQCYNYVYTKFQKLRGMNAGGIQAEIHSSLIDEIGRVRREDALDEDRIERRVSGAFQLFEEEN